MIFLASLEECTDDKLEGYSLIRTKDELMKIVADNTQMSRIIIRKDFAREFFTSTGLQSFVTKARSLNRALVIELEDDVKEVTTGAFIKKLRTAQTADELTTLSIMYPREFMEAMQFLVGKAEETEGELLAASNMVSRLQGVIEMQKSEIVALQDDMKMEQYNKEQAISKLDVLVKRINYQYDANVNVDEMFMATEHRYDKVIYIKEYSRVQFMDSFVYYLKEILKILYSMPTRLTVIESYYASLVPDMYPELTPHYKLRERDVIEGDILMLGYQPRLMKDILKNASNISILIVLDRGKYKTPHLNAKKVEYFYAASDIKDLPEDIPKSRILSYSNDTLHIPYIQGFDELDSSSRIQKYSSMDAIKQIIRVIE